MLKYSLILTALIIGSYFLGNVNFSIVISKILRHDVRKEGSGNPGTMNMLRSFGIKMGLLTLLFDALKGAGPALLGWWLVGGSYADPMSEAFMFGPDKTGLFVGGISAVIGHIFPVVFRFHGGKGVATSIGVCFVASPILAAIAFVIGVVYLLLVKVGSLTSFIMTGIPLIYCAVTSFLDGRIVVGIMAAALYLLILVRHYDNFIRIFRGEEKKVVLFGKGKSAIAAREAREAEAKSGEEDGKE